ncbi:MAG: energy transducer TonB [Bryobacteraceae bacterium]
MFEQVLMPTTRNKPWTLGASITLQCALVGTMVLYSALHVDLLPLNISRHLELPARPSPPVQAVEIVYASLEHRAGALTTTPRPFVSPTIIPVGVPEIIDAGSDAPVYSSTASTNGIGAPFTGLESFGAGPIAAPPPKQPAAHAQPAKQDTLLRQGGNVMEAKIIKRVMPVYPQLAKNARVSGKVHLMSVIAKDGTIQKLEVLDGHPLLVGAALAAVKQWIYQPTLLNGEPVDVMAPIEVNFTLTQ